MKRNTIRCLVLSSSVLFASYVHGDTVADVNGNDWVGRIERVDTKRVNVNLGCSGEIVSFTWRQIEVLRFGGKCLPDKIDPTGGALSCLDENANEVEPIDREPAWYLEKGEAWYYALELKHIKAGKLTFVDEQGRVQIIGTKNLSVQKIDQICP